MARRPRPSLADYAVIGISPALIMFLIGSLVFFLITVFYRGQYDIRLSFIMAMFIMAAVSIARISIEQGREYAALFALPLAGVTIFAMFRLVEFSGPFARLSSVLNVGLIAMIWFLADKLTWDCTVIDENEDQSGQGLLQTAGMHEGDAAQQSEAASDDPAAPQPPVESTGLWQKFVEHRRRPHAPGIWVIYFSLAALPIFGVGQLFLHDMASRRYAFKLLVVYVAAALGLLLTTSFLGLRRYLRQRRLEMPLEMASSWLGVGAVMIVALLVVCMLMPRRNAEYSVSDISFLNSPIDLPVSEWAIGNDGEEQDGADRTVQRDDGQRQVEGQQGEGGQNESPQAQGRDSSQSSQGDSGNSDSSRDPAGNRPSQGGNSDGQQRPNGSEPQADQAQDGQENRPQDGGEQGKKNGGPERQDPNRPTDPADDNQSSSGTNHERQPDGAEQQSDQSTRSNAGDRPQRAEPRPDASTPSSQSKSSGANLLSKLTPTLGGILKFLYWIIAIAVVGYLVWKHWERVRDAIQDFLKALRDFWERLFGGRSHDEETEALTGAEAIPTGPPFADFADPFTSGRADTMSMKELVGYTFQAFEAWGREHGCGRESEQTPVEFARIAAHQHGGLSKEALRIAELYNWTAFGKTEVPAANRQYLQRFWAELTGRAAV